MCVESEIPGFTSPTTLYPPLPTPPYVNKLQVLSQLLSQQTCTSSQCSSWLRKHTQILCAQWDLRKAPVSLAFKEGAPEICPTKCSFDYLPENGKATSTLHKMKQDHTTALTLNKVQPNETSKFSQSNRVPWQTTQVIPMYTKRTGP